MSYNVFVNNGSRYLVCSDRTHYYVKYKDCFEWEKISMDAEPIFEWNGNQEYVYVFDSLNAKFLYTITKDSDLFAELL